MRPSPSRRASAALSAIAALTLAVAQACSGPAPIGPSPGPTPIPTPAPATPPVIKSVTAAVTRVEVDTDVAVTADVEDAEKTASQLTFLWTATVGTIQGSGPTATWRLPKGTAPTPVDVVVSLTVVDAYQVLENGQLFSREYRVSADAPAFRVHDSVAEITTITETFLVKYFGDSHVAPGACLVDFSDSCPGKEAEYDDIADNRATRIILAAEARVQNITFTGPNAAAIVAPCRFEDELIATGARGLAIGDCVLTAVYERQRWWLCTSNFVATSGFGSMYEQYRRRAGRPPGPGGG